MFHDEAKRPLIYVCSPYHGNLTEMLQNRKAALAYCKFVTSCGKTPIAPHVYFTGFLDEDKPAERVAGIAMGIDLLRSHCDELWVFGDKITDGMRVEIVAAEQHGVPIRFVKGAFQDGKRLCFSV